MRGLLATAACTLTRAAAATVNPTAAEDARVSQIGRSGGTLLVADPPPQDIGRQALSITVPLRVKRASNAPALLKLRCGQGGNGGRDVTAAVSSLAGRGWTMLSVPLACLAGADPKSGTALFAITTGGKMRPSISSISLQPSRGEPCS